MYMPGTSIDWVGDDLDWVNGMSHLKVSMHNLAMVDMTDDTGMLVLPSGNPLTTPLIIPHIFSENTMHSLSLVCQSVCQCVCQYQKL